MAASLTILRRFRRLPGTLRRWRDPAIGLLLLPITWAGLPCLLPLVTFGIGVALFGEGMVAFTLSIAAGVAVAVFYPAWFGQAYFNAGEGRIPFADFIMSPMNSVIVGLLFLNAFFMLSFKNRYFVQYGLPMIRSRLRTARSRLGWGIALAAINFCDDLAAGGIVNRLYEDDVKSPGVRETIKRRMLLMALLLANAFPAVVPLSSWAAFYHGIDERFDWHHSFYVLLPLTLIVYSIWIVIDPSPRQQDGEDVERQSVIPVDFLRERQSVDPGMPASAFWLLLVAPYAATLVILFFAIGARNEDALLLAFSIGLILQILAMTWLGQFEHRWRMGASPLIESPRVARTKNGIAIVMKSLADERESLIQGAHQMMDAPIVSNDPAGALAALDSAVMLSQKTAAAIAALPKTFERLHPALQPEQPLCCRVCSFWKSQADKLLEDGIAQMVSSLIRVYLILVLGAATGACLGMSLDGQRSRIPTMLQTDGAPFHHWIYSVREFQLGSSVEIDFGVVVVAVLVTGLLVSLRHLRLSSAWGILAMVYPLAAVMLDPLGLPATKNGLPFVHACFFGLIVSFGVWCNSTLPTGDNVSITAEIHGRDPAHLARLSADINRWPVFFAAVGLMLALAFHRTIEYWPAWLLWGAMPLGWAIASSFIAHRLARRRIVTL